MAKRKRKNSLMYDTSSIVKSGVGIGIGTVVVVGAESAGGVSSHVLPSLGTAGRMLGPIATVKMGGHALRGLKGLRKASKRKRKGLY